MQHLNIEYTECRTAGTPTPVLPIRVGRGPNFITAAQQQTYFRSTKARTIFAPHKILNPYNPA